VSRHHLTLHDRREIRVVDRLRAFAERRFSRRDRLSVDLDAREVVRLGEAIGQSNVLPVKR
jgi:hypothetical protein